VAGLGEPVALGDVARQRPRQRAQAPGDQLEIGRARNDSATIPPTGAVVGFPGVLEPQPGFGALAVAAFEVLARALDGSEDAAVTAWVMF